MISLPHKDNVAQHISKEMIACRYNREADTMDAVLIDPITMITNVIQINANRLIIDMQTTQGHRSAEDIYVDKLALWLYTTGQGNLFIVREELNSGEWSPDPLYAVYWVAPLERLIMVDARVFRNARIEYEKHVDYLIQTQYNSYLKDTYPPSVTTAVIKAESKRPLAYVHISEIRIHKNIAKVKIDHGAIVSYDRSNWYDEFISDVGRVDGRAVGAVYRQLNARQIEGDSCNLYIFQNEAKTLIGAILSLKYDYDVGESYIVPMKSVDRYRSLVSRIGSIREYVIQ